MIDSIIMMLAYSVELFIGTQEDLNGQTYPQAVRDELSFLVAGGKLGTDPDNNKGHYTTYSHIAHKVAAAAPHMHNVIRREIMAGEHYTAQDVILAIMEAESEISIAHHIANG